MWIHTQKVCFCFVLFFCLCLSLGHCTCVYTELYTSAEQDRLHSLQGVFTSLQPRFYHRSQDTFVYTQTSTVDRSHTSSSARSISVFISAPKWGEPRGFSRVTAGFSSYDGEFRMPLVFAKGSLSSIRVAKESWDCCRVSAGPIDLI